LSSDASASADFFGEILFVLSVNDMFPPSVIAQAITPTLFAGFNLLWMFSLILLIVDKQKSVVIAWFHLVFNRKISSIGYFTAFFLRHNISSTQPLFGRFSLILLIVGK
jgi:hypothetical protein